MSKFNTSPESTVTTSHEGGIVYKSSHEFELYSLVVTELLEDKFYESKDDRLERLKKLVLATDSDFVMKLAIYAREEMHLRSIPIYLLMVLHVVRPEVVMHKALTRVIQRADEITETLACYDLLKTHTNASIRPISHQIIKAVKNAFPKFDEYQFAKYNSKKKFTLKDAVRLTHPRPATDAQAALFKKVVTDTLATPYTWETELSALGQLEYATEKDKKTAFQEKWVELINSGKLGYMAMLRNLRNILDNDVPLSAIETVASILENPEQVLKSKQFPFRFFSAAKSIENYTHPGKTRLVKALDLALKYSSKNIEFFKPTDSVFFACDTSGSMHSQLSRNSDVMYLHVGAVLAAIAQESVNYYSTAVFATHSKTVDVIPGSPLQNVEKILRTGASCGGGTDFQKVLDKIVKEGRQYDKICVFTDVQVNSLGYSVNSLWNKYREKFPNSKMYVFDLTGYGVRFTPMSDKSVIQVSGWSDKIFDMIEYVDNGSTFMQRILSVKLD